MLPDALAPERAVPRDAARVLAIAEVQRLAARVGARLAATDTADVPGGAELVAAWRRGLGDETLAADTLGDLGARAQAAGLPLLALKGADLALRVYGPGERAGNDIDLLVPPGRFEDAVRLLEDAGFRGDHPSPAWARSHWFAVTFRHARRARVQVDLHWGLGPPARTHWDIDAVLARSEPLPGRAGVRRMEPWDLAAYLALHAVAFHGASGRWLWWLDLFLLLGHAGWDDAALRARAEDVGATIAVAAARLRVTELFGGHMTAATWRARAIAAAGRCSEDFDLGRLARWPVAALAIDRPRDLLAAAASRVTRP